MSAAETNGANDPAAQQTGIERAFGAPLGVGLPPHEVARADGEHREAARAVPGWNDSQRAAAVLENPVPTCSELFPLGEGTAEQVVSGLGHLSERPILEVGNGSEQLTISAVTNQTSPDPSTSTPRGYSPERSAASDHQTATTPPSAQQIRQQVLGRPQPLSSWAPLDLSEMLHGLQQGTLEQPQPTVAGWLYPGAVNGLAGESGCGKTWTALVSAGVEMLDGNSAVYVDLEDNPISVVGRLLALGVPSDVIAERFVYVRPEVAFVDDLRAVFWQMLDEAKPTLVVLDSTGESMALEGVDQNDDRGVARWFQRVARPIAERGPAVLLLDHLPKSDTAAASPIGSQRKRAAISGVQMTQTVAKSMSFAKGRPGVAKLTCTKDRHGNFVTGESVMRLLVNPEPTRGEAGVNAELSRISGGQVDDAPTRVMVDICEFLEQQGSPQNTSAIKQAVRAQGITVNSALDVLVESGYLTVASGTRNSIVYTLVNPFSIDDPYTVPEPPEVAAQTAANLQAGMARAAAAAPATDDHMAAPWGAGQ